MLQGCGRLRKYTMAEKARAARNADQCNHCREEAGMDEAAAAA